MRREASFIRFPGRGEEPAWTGFVPGGKRQSPSCSLYRFEGIDTGAGSPGQPRLRGETAPFSSRDTISAPASNNTFTTTVFAFVKAAVYRAVSPFPARRRTPRLVEDSRLEPAGARVPAGREAACHVLERPEPAPDVPVHARPHPNDHQRATCRHRHVLVSGIIRSAGGCAGVLPDRFFPQGDSPDPERRREAEPGREGAAEGSGREALPSPPGPAAAIIHPPKEARDAETETRSEHLPHTSR